LSLIKRTRSSRRGEKTLGRKGGSLPEGKKIIDLREKGTLDPSPSIATSKRRRRISKWGRGERKNELNSASRREVQSHSRGGKRYFKKDEKGTERKEKKNSFR